MKNLHIKSFLCKRLFFGRSNIRLWCKFFFHFYKPWKFGVIMRLLFGSPLQEYFVNKFIIYNLLIVIIKIKYFCR